MDCWNKQFMSYRTQQNRADARFYNGGGVINVKRNCLLDINIHGVRSYTAYLQSI